MPYKIDMTGEKHNRLTVISMAYVKNDNTFWNCLCDCGNSKVIDGRRIRAGYTKSCGCLHKEVSKNNSHKFLDITHHIYGRWLVLFPVEKDKKGSYKWMCRCDCGELKAVGITSLRKGNSKSCGCLLREQSVKNAKYAIKHNMSHSREYSSWRSMKDRCTNIKATGYINYGGAGVKVCDRWMNSFENFYADMGARPPNTSLDRIDPFGHYEPDNCRWANQSTQSKNQKRHLFKEQGICLFLKVR